MRHSIVVQLAFCLAMLGCSSEQNSEAKSNQGGHETSITPSIQQQFAWLEGIWLRTTSRGERFERWVQDDSGLTGLAFRIQDGDTLVGERLWLIADGQEIYYVAHPKENPEPTSFRLTSHDSLSFTFENPEHDFPTKITYLNNPPDSMVATIEGPDGNEKRTIDFVFRRMDQAAGR